MVHYVQQHESIPNDSNNERSVEYTSRRNSNTGSIVKIDKNVEGKKERPTETGLRGDFNSNAPLPQMSQSKLAVRLMTSHAHR